MTALAKLEDLQFRLRVITSELGLLKGDFEDNDDLYTLVEEAGDYADDAARSLARAAKQIEGAAGGF